MGGLEMGDGALPNRRTTLTPVRGLPNLRSVTGGRRDCVGLRVFDTGVASVLVRRGEGADVKVVHCPCGVDVKGESEVENVEAHIAKDHPEMVGKCSREQILEMADDTERGPGGPATACSGRQLAHRAPRARIVRRREKRGGRATP